MRQRQKATESNASEATIHTFNSVHCLSYITPSHLWELPSYDWRDEVYCNAVVAGAAVDGAVDGKCKFGYWSRALRWTADSNTLSLIWFTNMAFSEHCAHDNHHAPRLRICLGLWNLHNAQGIDAEITQYYFRKCVWNTDLMSSPYSSLLATYRKAIF